MKAAHRVSSRPTLRCGARNVNSLCQHRGVEQRFREPGWFTKHVFNRLVALLTKLGLSVAGSRVLEVRGRKSGEWRRTPVNLLAHEGERYLVAPRGNTQWVRNIRVSGGGRLVLGRRTEDFKATEVDEDEKPALLRAYLEKWKWEVGAFFDGVGPDASDEELRRIGPDHPPSASRHDRAIRLNAVSSDWRLKRRRWCRRHAGRGRRSRRN